MTITLHTMQTSLIVWMHRYRELALWLERNGPASDKLLHMNAGLIIWLITVILRGRNWGDRRNLIPVFLLEGLNEIADYLYPVGWTLEGTIGDLFWTFVWPVVLVWAIGGSSGRRGRR